MPHFLKCGAFPLDQAFGSGSPGDASSLGLELLGSKHMLSTTATMAELISELNRAFNEQFCNQRMLRNTD